MNNTTQNQPPTLPEGKFEFWRYFLLTIIVIVITLITQSVLILIASLFEGNFDVMNYSPFTLLWVSMLPFGVLLIALVIGIRFIHQQSIKTIFSQKEKLNRSLFIKSFIVWFVLSGLADIILALLQPGNYSLTFSIRSFVPYMLLAFGLILIQVTAEEVLFRHYFLHAFFRLFRNRWVAIILQATLFGLLHGANPEVSMYGILTTMPIYIGIGLILGWFSFRSKGLEIALGLHLANNFYATAMVTFEGSAIPSPAIFTIQNYQPENGLIVFIITSIIFSVIMIRSVNGDREVM